MYKIFDKHNEEIVTLNKQRDVENFAQYYKAAAFLVKETPREMLENRGVNINSLTADDCVRYVEEITFASKYGWDTPLYTMFMEDNSGWKRTAFEALALFFQRKKGWELVEY